MIDLILLQIAPLGTVIPGGGVHPDVPGRCGAEGDAVGAAVAGRGGIDRGPVVVIRRSLDLVRRGIASTPPQRHRVNGETGAEIGHDPLGGQGALL